MKTTVEIKDGEMRIAISTLMDSLDDEDMHEMVETLACMDAVIEKVTQQILEGFTENGNSGSYSITHPEERSYALGKARHEVAERYDEATAKRLRKLERHGKFLRTRMRECQDEKRALARALREVGHDPKKIIERSQ